MLQFLAVLAIVAILATLLLPSFIRQADRSAWEFEVSALESFAESLPRQAIRTRQIPAVAEFPQTIAASLDQSAWQVRTNGRYLPRVFLVDPNLDIGGVGAGDLPYVQTAAGSATPPVNARALMVSTIAGALPAVSSSDFDDIWSTPEQTVPSALAASWGGKADDLLIRRLDLGPLFHRVRLMNVDVDNNGYYSIDNFAMTHVPGRSALADPPNWGEAWFLDGTELHFYRADTTGDCREILHEDLSFVYQHNRWRRRVTALDDSLDEFGQWVHEFLSPPAPSDPKFAATQQAVIDVFFDYLWGYARWAYGDTNATPPVPPYAGSGTSSTPQYPSYSQVFQAQGNLDTFTSNLIE